MFPARPSGPLGSPARRGPTLVSGAGTGRLAQLARAPRLHRHNVSKNVDATTYKKRTCGIEFCWSISALHFCSIFASLLRPK